MATPVQIASQRLTEGDLVSFRAIVERNPELLALAGLAWLGTGCEKGDVEILACLFDLGVDINASDYLGTALTRAASSGSMACTQWLLEHEAELNTDVMSHNALFAAIQMGHDEIAKLLIDSGIDTKVTYPCGHDALAFARQWNRTEIILKLGGIPEPRKAWVKTDLPDFTGRRMSLDQLCGIESELQILLPKFFKEFLLHEFPEDLFFPTAKDNDEWEWLGPDYLLFHTARSFIAYNCEDSRATSKEMLNKEFLAFGTNGGGDNWCIRLDASDERVHFHNHELDQFHDTGTSLRDHVSRLPRRA